MFISITQPLSGAWKRMTRDLFRPFDINKWFAVGFCAFLAGLIDWPFNGNSGSRGDADFSDLHQLRDLPYRIQAWVSQHPGWTILILLFICLIIALIILLTWLSSRGKFMFLHNVVLNKAEIKHPWHEYKTLGNSVFLWRLIFGAIMFAISIFYLAILTLSIIFQSTGDITVISVLMLIGGGVSFLTILIIAAYISMFLNNFVIPIMYKRNIRVIPAWNEFIRLFRKHAGGFLLYGLFLFLLYVVLIIGIIFVGFFTCCVGFVLVAIPYVNSVVLLPFSYTFRAYSLEFLEQFGEEYKFFPGEEPVPAA